MTIGLQASASTTRFDISIFAGPASSVSGSGYVEMDTAILDAGIASGSTIINGALLGGQFTLGSVLFDTLVDGTLVGAPGGVVSGLTLAVFSSSGTADTSIRFYTSSGFPNRYDLTVSGTTSSSQNPGYALSESTPPVPLPAGLPLIASGLALFGIMRRYRKA